MEQVKQILLNNDVAILKADTVWGIFAKISEENRQKINLIKQSNQNKLISIAFSDVEQAKEYVNEEHHEFLTDFPGKITKILKSAKKLINILPSYKYVGVRIMEKEKLNEVIKITGPLFTTSANITGESTPKESKRLEKIFGTEVEYIEEGSFINTEPSTIYTYVDGNKKRIR